MAVPHAILLLAMGRAHARIHVEHDAAGRSAAMHKVDPLARQVGKSRKVLVCSKPLRLKAANLARRSGAPLRRLPPTIQRIAGSWRRRSASFTSSYPARRPNTDCRNNPANACRPFLPLILSQSGERPVDDHGGRVFGRADLTRAKTLKAIAQAAHRAGLDRQLVRHWATPEGSP